MSSTRMYGLGAAVSVRFSCAIDCDSQLDCACKPLPPIRRVAVVFLKIAQKEHARYVASAPHVGCTQALECFSGRLLSISHETSPWWHCKVTSTLIRWLYRPCKFLLLFRNMHASEVKRSFDFMCSVTVFAQLGGGVRSNFTLTNTVGQHNFRQKKNTTNSTNSILYLTSYIQHIESSLISYNFKNKFCFYKSNPNLRIPSAIVDLSDDK